MLERRKQCFPNHKTHVNQRMVRTSRSVHCAWRYVRTRDALRCNRTATHQPVTAHQRWDGQVAQPRGSRFSVVSLKTTTVSMPSCFVGHSWRVSPIDPSRAVHVFAIASSGTTPDASASGEARRRLSAVRRACGRGCPRAVRRRSHRRRGRPGPPWPQPPVHRPDVGGAPSGASPPSRVRQSR